ncbi:hypothetical protein Tco_1370671 [Tanacetum coccineum]
MQLLYCFINNVHVDYAEILWEGLHYSLMHPANLIPYLRFTKIIIDYYMTENPDISCRVHDNYHRVKNDDLVKNIFNSRKNKDRAGMKIPNWMVTEAMNLTHHYNMYVTVFWVDNVEQVKEHMVDEELDHLLDGTKNVDVDEFMSDILNNQEDLDTRIDPGSYKETAGGGE